MRFDMICGQDHVRHRSEDMVQRHYQAQPPVAVRGSENSPGGVFPNDGQVQRTRRTITDATVKRFHHHDQPRTHLAEVMAAYDLARRLKTLASHGPSTDGGPRLALTPCEYICKI